jgi:hypothetical protein
MNRRRSLIVLVAAALIVACVTQAAAQAPAKFQAGARVEVNTYGTDGTFQGGTITQVDDQRPAGGNLKYLIHLDVPSPDSKTSDVSAFENEVRALLAFTPFNVGSVVDVYYSPGVGRDRGIVKAVTADGRYRIHFPGCNPTTDPLVDHALVLAPKKLSRSSAQARFLVGKWIMFTPSYPNTVVHDGSIYRQYGTGARTPPLVIKANGRFVWYFDFGKKPVRGTWTTDAKIPGADTGVATIDGLIIKDPQGKPWKVYKRTVKGDHKSHLTAQRLCSGITDIGTKAS